MSTQLRPDCAPAPSRSVDLIPVADSITRTILHCRDGLPKTANGHTVAPSNPSAAQIRKHMTSGVANPVLQLATVVYTDLEDGVPYHIATAGITRLLTFLKVHADAMRRHAPRSITSAFHSKTRRQHRADLAAHRVLTAPICEASLTEAIAETRQHIAALEDFAVACEAELASRSSSRVHALKALGGAR